MNWRFIEYEKLSGKRNMEIDEGLFLDCELGSGLPTLRFYGWHPWCVSIGKNQDLSIVNIDECQRLGVDIVRRFTGGGALLHAEEIAYSVVAYIEDLPEVYRNVMESYHFVHRWLIYALKKIGIDVVFGKGSTKHVEICFSQTSHYELQVSGRKLVGSAQRRGRRAFLQHGSILLRANPEMTARVLNPPSGIDRDAFYAQLAHRSIGLLDICGDGLTIEDFVELLRNSFVEHLSSVV